MFLFAMALLNYAIEYAINKIKKEGREKRKRCCCCICSPSEFSYFGYFGLLFINMYVLSYTSHINIA